MAVFLRDPTYPENEEDYSRIYAELQQRALLLLPNARIIEADAGPSASIPGWMISFGALGWFIFSAPSTIKENLPLWQEYYSNVVKLAEEIGASLSIDVHDAAAKAIIEASTRYGWNESDINIISCFCHCRNLGGAWSQEIDLHNLTEPTESLDLHQQACRQLECRYIFMLESSYDCATVIIARDGQCEFAEMLN